MQDGAELTCGTNVHKLPMDGPEKAVRNTAGAHLNYYGGKVVQNAKVVQVIYGAGTYLGNITGTATPTVASFFSSVLASTYIDWLSEYNTGSPSQRIGRGTFSKKVTITPSSSRNGPTSAPVRAATLAAAAAPSSATPPR